MANTFMSINIYVIKSISFSFTITKVSSYTLVSVLIGVVLHATNSNTGSIAKNIFFIRFTFRYHITASIILHLSTIF